MKRVLYLGLEIPQKYLKEGAIHCPLIAIKPRSPNEKEIRSAFHQFHDYTHIIFTSKNGVSIFFEYAPDFGITQADLQSKQYIVVGKETATKLVSYGSFSCKIAVQETAEGIVELMETVDLQNAYIFWPHSALSRSIIPTWLEQKKLRYLDCIFYDTFPKQPQPFPDLNQIDEIVFTSPSTVDAFIQFFGKLPQDKVLTAIGPVTQEKISSC